MSFRIAAWLKEAEECRADGLYLFEHWALTCAAEAMLHPDWTDQQVIDSAYPIVRAAAAA